MNPQSIELTASMAQFVLTLLIGGVPTTAILFLAGRRWREAQKAVEAFDGKDNFERESLLDSIMNAR